MQERRLVIGPRLADGSFSLTRQPDGLTLRARSWDDVWAACPEFDVPWRSIDFSDSQVHDVAVISWGEHPDMPPRPTN